MDKDSQFEKVVRAYSAELYRFAYWLCRERFTAEDLVQETFARAWRSWNALRDEGAVKSWLYTILRNEHARLYERKQVDIDDEQEIDVIPDAERSAPIDAMEVRDALKKLAPGYREPLMLQTIGGFSCAEIAQMMDISKGAVMTRLTRARAALRKLHGWRGARKVTTG